MRRREFITLLAGLAAAWPLAARGQRGERMRRIGVLLAVAESDADVRKGIAIFQQRLQELGWRDCQNIRIDYRWGDADPRRIQALAKELVELHPDALVGHSTPSARGLLNQTRSIPIVFLTVTDPLGQGLVSSLSRPNGNITGFSVFEFSLGTKWVETLKQIAPWYSTCDRHLQPGHCAVLRALFKINRCRCVFPGYRAHCGPSSQCRKRIIELAAEYRLPTIYYFRYFASDGGLIAYGPDEMDLFQRTAGYVDRILKGTTPSDLPVQQPAKFELVINLKTAKAIGIQIPVALLARADEVFE